MTIFKTRSRVIQGSALALASMLALSGCAGRDEAPSGNASQPAGAVQTGPGFDGTTIDLAMLSVTSGPLAVPAATLADGMLAYFAALNETGGIAGKYKVNLNVLDTAYDTPTAMQQYSSTKNDVVTYAQIFGTAITKALLPQFDADGVVAIPAISDGKLLQEQSLVLTTNPDVIDAVSGLEWYHSENPDAVVCFAQFNGELGVAYGEALAWAAEQLGTEVRETVVLDPNSTDYTPQIQQLMGAGCTVVFEKGSGVILTTAMQNSAQLGFDADWIAPYTDWTPNLKDSPLNDFIAEHFHATSNAVVFGDEAPGMEAMMAAHAKHSPDVVPVWLWTNGYVSGKVVADFLEKAVANGDLSREGFKNAVNSTTELDFGGIQVSQPFGPPGQRGVADQVNILKYDSSSPTGLSTAVDGHESVLAPKYKIGD